MSDWSRLAKLAGMLGSESDGERLNAARLLDAALKREGATFGDLAQRIADGNAGSSAPPRTVYVEKRAVLNPAGALAQKIIDTAKDKLTKSERAFLKGIVQTCEMTGGNFDMTMFQARYLGDLEKIYVLGTMKKASPPGKRGPVPKAVLDELGLGAAETARDRYKRGRQAYRPKARMVDDDGDMPDARDDVETRNNTAWAARKVDLDFDDDLGF